MVKEILMEVPSKFSGPEYRRVGAIVQEVNTGKIVGHLKEVGGYAMGLSNPIEIVGTAVDVASNVAQNFQLQKIQQTLDGLQLVSHIGVASSVVSLGVSVAGFAVVSKKLNNIENKLDGVAKQIHEISEALSRMDQKWDLLHRSRLDHASELLIHAEASSDVVRQREQLLDANREFGLLKSYFFQLVQELNPMMQPTIAISYVEEMLVRYLVAAMGYLQSGFLLGDMGSYRSILNKVNQELFMLMDYDNQAAYLARCDRRFESEVEVDFSRLADEMNLFRGFTVEMSERLQSYGAEIDYIEHYQIEPLDYICALQEQDPGIVLIPV